MSNIHTHASRNTRALTAAEQAAAVAAFLKTRGVTKCPTAFVLPTQTRLPEKDREALQRYAEMLEERRLAKTLPKAN
jgi:hypothetical protein